MQSKPFGNELHDFLTALNYRQSADDVWRLAVQFMRGQGASHLNLGMARDGLLTFMKWTSPDWIREMYLEQIYPDHDPKLEHCRNNVTPYLFGKEFWHLHPEVPAKRRRFDEELVGVGTRSVVSFPVHMPVSRSWGYVSVHADRRADQFEAFIAEKGITLHLAGTMAFNRIQMLLGDEKASDIGLTADEQECLLWLSRGLRKSEIADRIGVGAASVALHLTNARAKLDANTLDQAMVSALQLGLIEI